MSRTIFDILTSDPAVDSRAEIRASAEEQYLSIRNHLWRLFNSRRGTLIHMPLFGMPDIAALYLELPYTSDRIMSALRQCVVDFEPRLDHPYVRPIHREDNRDVTQFELSGETPLGRRVKYIVSLYRTGAIEVAAAWEPYAHG